MSYWQRSCWGEDLMFAAGQASKKKETVWFTLNSMQLHILSTERFSRANSILQEQKTGNSSEHFARQVFIFTEWTGPLSASNSLVHNFNQDFNCHTFNAFWIARKKIIVFSTFHLISWSWCVTSLATEKALSCLFNVLMSGRNTFKIR